VQFEKSANLKSMGCKGKSFFSLQRNLKLEEVNLITSLEERSDCFESLQER